MNYILQFLLFLIWYHISTVSTDNLGDDIETPLTRVRRGGLSMLRLGRGLQMLRLGKRSMPMLRLGRSLDTLSDDDIKYLLFSLYGGKTDNAFRRQVPLPRYGREDSELQTLVELLLQQEGLRNSPYDPDNESLRQIRLAPRPGRIRRSADNQMQDDDEEMKEAFKTETKEMNDKYIKSLPLPRFGRLLGSERAIPLPRFGRQMYDYIYALEPASEYEKGNEQNMDKRGMHMLRLGRAMNMLRLGKRPMSMLRLGRSELPQAGSDGDDKRSLSMLRLGKRLHMLRLGKRSDDKADKKSSLTDNASESDSEHNINTRAMNMLRLGRSAP